MFCLFAAECIVTNPFLHKLYLSLFISIPFSFVSVDLSFEQCPLLMMKIRVTLHITAYQNEQNFPHAYIFKEITEVLGRFNRVVITVSLTEKGPKHKAVDNFESHVLFFQKISR